MEKNKLKSDDDYIRLNSTAKEFTLFTLIIYSFVYMFKIFLGFNINSNLMIKCISNIFGKLFSIKYSIKYNLYLQNLLKYISIFFFQHIFSKLMIFNYNIFSFENIFRTNIYIFIYILFDIILDVIIEDNNKKKKMIIDVVKTLFGFIIVETLINKKIDVNEYVYILVLSFGIFIYYNHLEDYIT